MKIVTSVSVVQAVDSEWKEPRGVVNAVCDETHAGFIRTLQLGEAGLLVKAPNGTKVGISMQALLSLVESCDPGMLPKSKQG